MRHRSPARIVLPLALALSACGGSGDLAERRALPVPEEPGLYVTTKADDLRRVDGTDAWERSTWGRRSDLAPDVRFVAYDRGLARAQEEVPARLWRVSWVRSEIRASGAAAPVSGSRWTLAPIESRQVPLRATRHPSIPGLLYLDTPGRLDPGLYEIVLRDGVRRRARIGVQWSSLDRQDYAAATCVDRVSGGGFAPCGASAAAGVASSAGTAAASGRSAAVSRSRRPSARNRPDRAGGDRLTREVETALSGQGRAEAPAQGGAPRLAGGQRDAGGAALRVRLEEPVERNGRLRINGTVVNRSATPRRVPMLEAKIVRADGRLADRWRFRASRTAVEAGGAVAFSTVRPAPPDASRLDVDFVGR